jgi:hypothetical protein
MAAMPANANTLAFSPFSHSGPHRIHHAGHFMPWNSGIGDSWPAPFEDDRIAVAHTACLNFDAHLSQTWVGNLQLNDPKTGSSRSHLGGFHGSYCDCSCHKFSYTVLARADGFVTIARPLDSLGTTLNYCGQVNHVKLAGR